MEEILQVFARLAALLEQYDTAEQGVATLEMQNEGFYRMTSEWEKDNSSAKSSIAKTLRLVTAQREAFKRAILDITGISPADLRDRLQDIKISIDHAGEYSFEEKKLRKVFEILVDADSFGEDAGETRPDFENRLSNIKRLKEFSIQQLMKLVNSTINKKTIVGATDSVLSTLKNRNVGETQTIILG